MKKIVRLMLSCVLMLFVPALAMAQMDGLKNSTPEERATMLTSMMQSELTLDEKATSAVSDINLKYARETQTLMDSSGTQFGKVMTFRKNELAKSTELKGVLTPEQYSLYEQKKSAMQETLKQKLKEKHQVSQQ
jgi:hypothetical protein